MRRIDRRVFANVVPCLIATCLAAGAQTGTPTSHADQEFLARFSAAAIERTHHSLRYVSAYVHLSYPGVDIPTDTGVCTDEVIRSYRAVEVDLQKEVHDDMLRHFDAYPHRHQRAPDSNIDHRRVPNLMVFFARNGMRLAISQHAEDYSPGDVVVWDLGVASPTSALSWTRKEAGVVT